ncbi:MAG: lipoprotein [Comamonadaceae bacterium]|nr:MAG: lipoprotein [Comamonadaceae bacterium]
MSEKFKTFRILSGTVPIMLLILHLLFIGLWLGCVLTEALFERALLGQGRAHELLLADLHKRVDVWVEIPAFVAVLVTGGMLLAQAAPSHWLYTKVAFGLLAVLTNGVCVGLVFARAKAAHRGNWEHFDRLDSLQHKLGAVVLLALLVALVIGLTLLA